jgi:hypothetical protein
VALLGVGMHAQADDADQPLREDCAEDLRLRDQLREPVQQLFSFILECRGERLRILAQTLKADVPVSQGIGASE